MLNLFQQTVDRKQEFLQNEIFLNECLVTSVFVCTLFTRLSSFQLRGYISITSSDYCTLNYPCIINYKLTIVHLDVCCAFWLELVFAGMILGLSSVVTLTFVLIIYIWIPSGCGRCTCQGIRHQTGRSPPIGID